jgi:hypothetical protein
MHTTFYLFFHNRVAVPAATVLVDMVEDVDGPLCDTHIVSIGFPAICGWIHMRIARMPSNPDFIERGVPGEDLNAHILFKRENTECKFISILPRFDHALEIPAKILVPFAVKCIPLALRRPEKTRETVLMVFYTANSIGP